MKRLNFTAETLRRRVRTSTSVSLAAFAIAAFSLCLCASVVNVFAQTETPPAPGAPKSGTVPAVQEKKLGNGLTVAVVERKGVPLVTIQLLVKSGASAEQANKAGLADLTASMLTKGTKTKTATQIAEEIEFLGGSINSGAGWNSSFVSVTVTSDKVDQAMAILADVVLNPKFDQKELDLLKSQTLDGLTYNLKQPSFLANYVASKYSFGEHPAGGTPASIGSITSSDVSAFHDKNYRSDTSVLIFTGDISLAKAAVSAEKIFAGMKKWEGESGMRKEMVSSASSGSPQSARRILVIDLPKSGQAAVSYYDQVLGVGRKSGSFYPATVMNTVLGGGYSARLNYEIRIKRGLSYGAGSNVGWRWNQANFGTRAQTKNESAAEVAELTMTEVMRMTNSSVGGEELVPRKSVLTGNFGRNLETTNGLAAAVGELYSFGIPTSELNLYVSSVNGVTDAQIKDFASKNLLGGDIIIVGDYSVFKDDLAKRFPNMKIDVIKADELDLSKDNLRK
ncbi:MAG: insulinase family protein [Acidobacteria bacterium]|nr:insulinase family protein [Acidobacteriota bacterium]